LSLKYAGASRQGTPDTTNADGNIKVNAFSLGLNYWATKHIRLSANYVLNMFPSSEPVSPTTAKTPTSPASISQSSANRALAPGNTIAPGSNNDARDNGHTLNEFLLRCAVAL
jgi:hypothetical protein